MIDELFSSRTKRDDRATELKSHGYKVKRYSIRGQQIHPMYVEDLKDTPEGLDRGLGNTVYKSFFSVLYGVKEVL